MCSICADLFSTPHESVVSSMTRVIGLSLAGLMFTFGATAIAYSGYLRGGRRLTWNLLGFWVAVPSAITVVILGDLLTFPWVISGREVRD